MYMISSQIEFEHAYMVAHLPCDNLGNFLATSSGVGGALVASHLRCSRHPASFRLIEKGLTIIGRVKRRAVGPHGVELSSCRISLVSLTRSRCGVSFRVQSGKDC